MTLFSVSPSCLLSVLAWLSSYLDSSFNLEIAFAAGLMLLGTGLVITLERLANRKEAPQGSASEATA